MPVPLIHNIQLFSKIIPKHIITNILNFRLYVNNAILIKSFVILGVSSAIIPASYPSIATQLYGFDVKGKTTDIC